MFQWLKSIRVKKKIENNKWFFLFIFYFKNKTEAERRPVQLPSGQPSAQLCERLHVTFPDMIKCTNPFRLLLLNK